MTITHLNREVEWYVWFKFVPYASSIICIFSASLNFFSPLSMPGTRSVLSDSKQVLQPRSSDHSGFDNTGDTLFLRKQLFSNCTWPKTKRDYPHGKWAMHRI